MSSAELLRKAAAWQRRAAAATIDLKRLRQPMAGRNENHSRNIPRQGCTRWVPATKSTDFRKLIKGRKWKATVSGARGLETGHAEPSARTSQRTAWMIIMNIPTVRMNPNSASALKLEVASEAVAVAAVVRMQKTTLSPVVSKVRKMAACGRPWRNSDGVPGLQFNHPA